MVGIEHLAHVLIDGRSRVRPGVADVTLLVDALACERAVLVTGDEPLLEIAQRVQAYFPQLSSVHRDAWFEAL
ncbi:MAG: hypothetical protein KF894_26940 [Labilithrix sp.]|nr:hypothetical protein [Labilithrix sp.]